jgi:hypothetical protein
MRSDYRLLAEHVEMPSPKNESSAERQVLSALCASCS